MKEQYIVRFNRIKTLLYCIAALILAGFTVVILYASFERGSVIAIIVALVLCLAGVLFFGFIFLYLIRTLFDRRPMLIIDRDGITDNSSAAALGFIPWSDLGEARVTTLAGNEFVELRLRHEEKYFETMSGLKKLLIKANRTGGHEIVCLNLLTVNCSSDEILREIEKMRKPVLKRKAEADQAD